MKKRFPARYIAFQKAVKELTKSIRINGEKITPLEYDYYEWGT